MSAIVNSIAWLQVLEPKSRLQARLIRWFRLLMLLQKNWLSMAGLIILMFLIVAAVTAPLSFSYDDTVAQRLAARLQPPSAHHWFGTDELGRDIFARVVYGTRTTLIIVLLVSVVVLPTGLAVGLPAGFLGGLPDRILMRVTDVFLAFPRLVLALAFAAALGPGIENAVLALAVTSWPPYARLARAEALRVRCAEFVEASKLAGASNLRIILVDIAPLCIPSALIRLTLDMSGMILTAAGLGFLGLGAQPPTPEWGAMVASGRQYLLDYWWVATIPGFAIFVASLSFNLLGDGLRDLSDSRSD